MRVVELATWIAAGLAVIGVGLAAWQLRKAYLRAQTADQNAKRIQMLAEEAGKQAARAEHEAKHASGQARWAWEQVKLASDQLEQAQTEHKASAESEHWEWSYALTTSAREAVDASGELIRIALDGQVAPHYRVAAERHYNQTATRWQETMTKALARTEPTLELQQQVLTFTQVQHRLHGHIGVMLRAAETGTLTAGDMLSRQVLGTCQELETVRRQLQRTVSATLVGEHFSSGEQPAVTAHATRLPELENGPATVLTRAAEPASSPEPARQPVTGRPSEAVRQSDAARQDPGRQSDPRHSDTTRRQQNGRSQETTRQQVRGSLGEPAPEQQNGHRQNAGRRDQNGSRRDLVGQAPARPTVKPVNPPAAATGGAPPASPAGAQPPAPATPGRSGRRGR